MRWWPLLLLLPACLGQYSSPHVHRQHYGARRHPTYHSLGDPFDSSGGSRSYGGGRGYRRSLSYDVPALDESCSPYTVVETETQVLTQTEIVQKTIVKNRVTTATMVLTQVETETKTETSSVTETEVNTVTSTEQVVSTETVTSTNTETLTATETTVIPRTVTVTSSEVDEKTVTKTVKCTKAPTVVTKSYYDLYVGHGKGDSGGHNTDSPSRGGYGDTDESPPPAEESPNPEETPPLPSMGPAGMKGIAETPKSVKADPLPPTPSDVGEQEVIEIDLSVDSNPHYDDGSVYKYHDDPPPEINAIPIARHAEAGRSLGPFTGYPGFRDYSFRGFDPFDPYSVR